MNSRRRPVHEIRVGRIRASVWANRHDRQGVWYSVSISRAYRDGEAWKDTTSFGRDDLPLVAKVADMAFAWIWNQAGNGEVGGGQPNGGS